MMYYTDEDEEHVVGEPVTHNGKVVGEITHVYDKRHGELKLYDDITIVME